MSFKEGLLAARSHLIILAGIIIASGAIIRLELWKEERGGFADMNAPHSVPSPQNEELTEQELLYANIAWKYFKNNYNAETGMINSADNYQAFTMHSTGSYLLGAISAHKLEIIDYTEFNERITQALNTLTNLKLFDDKLPNKSYNSITLEMTDYRNASAEKGIGWSSIDIARLIVPILYLKWHHREYFDEINEILRTWKFSYSVADGQLAKTALVNGKVKYYQEGRFGYEEYAAKSFIHIGLDAYNSLMNLDKIKLVKIYDIDVPADIREPSAYSANNYVLSDPFINEGLEFGLNSISKQFAWQIYCAQEKRYQTENILTAVGEDHIDTIPYFVYNTVYSNGLAWNCITPSGANADDYKTLSVKSAFGWFALFRTEYSKKLIERISDCYDINKGWYAGIYEKSGKVNKALTCNTNSAILTALCYKKYGSLLRFHNY